MLQSYKMFFIILKSFSMVISLFSESLLMLYVGLELKVFSIVPLFGHTSQKESVKYFVMQVFGSLFFLSGVVLGYSTMLMLGLLMKMGSFPFYWFPSLVSALKDPFMIFWLVAVKKIPMYFIFNEVVDWNSMTFFWVSTMMIITPSVGLFISNSLGSLLGWSSLVHTGLSILLLPLVDPLMFFLLYLFNVLLIFLLCRVVMYKWGLWSGSNTTPSYLWLFFSVAGLPLFLKIFLELMLLSMLSSFAWRLVLAIALMAHTYGFIALLLTVWGHTNAKYFFSSAMIGGWGIFALPVFYWFFFS